VAGNVCVIGGGIIGLAVAYELSRTGTAVTIVSADVPGSRQSAGRSRIFRLAHADATLTDAAATSSELWASWEELAGEPLLDRVGLLLTGDMSDREIHLRRHGGLERASGARHPLAIAHDEWWFEATGAAIHVERTMRFLQQHAGLSVMLAEVSSVDAGGATLAGGGRVDADRVVVCAGPDTYGLLGLPEPARLRSVRFSFALREPLAAPAPCWIQRDDALSEPFYAVMDGPHHYSIGLSDAAPAELPEAEHVRDAHRRAVDIVARVFPALHAIAERVIACTFSLNPSGPLEHDGWDLREHDGVLGLTGPSLFKFAPLLGRLVVDRLR
jgi:sarcosine oxidase